jgi:aryl-alcohol dehydrogenase-like predicted oxidoreductase
MHIFTKVGSDMGQGRKDLSAKWILDEVEASLKRLQTDYIDLYQSHWPDPTVAQEETLGAYDRLIKAGKVRHIGCSNYDEALLNGALKASAEKNLPRYATLQNEYNLYTRDKYEGAVQDIVVREGMSLIPYYSLASGFLTGKYRAKGDLGQSARGSGVGKYLNARGLHILGAMDTVAAETGAAHAEIALAWINAQPGVAAPIASATSVEQLQSLVRGARLELDADCLKLLTDASR